MKSAEDFAKEYLNTHRTVNFNGLVKALTEYAEERVKDALEHSVSEEIPKYFMLGRNEALDEAAQIIEGFTILDPIGAAVAIRALK